MDYFPSAKINSKTIKKRKKKKKKKKVKFGSQISDTEACFEGGENFRFKSCKLLQLTNLTCRYISHMHAWPTLKPGLCMHFLLSNPNSFYLLTKFVIWCLNILAGTEPRLYLGATNFSNFVLWNSTLLFLIILLIFLEIIVTNFFTIFL